MTTKPLHWPQRKRLRLKNYDYSAPGQYFITICTYKFQPLFGKNNHGHMILNPAGEMIKFYWMDLPKKFPSIKLHEFIIMPNHMHGIIEIMDHHDNQIGNNIGAYKSITTVEYIRQARKNNFPEYHEHLWKHRFYDHIIRNKIEYHNISQYIKNNPIIHYNRTVTPCG